MNKRRDKTMTVTKCMEELASVNKQHNDEEDKIYYLVHKTMELIIQLSDEEIKELGTQILQKYDYKNYSSFCEYVCVMSKHNIYTQDKVHQNSEKDKANIENITDFYSEYDENLIRYIKGHLFLEFAMNTIIEKALNVTTRNKTFSNKITLLYDNSLLSPMERDLLKSINKERNEIAHNLNYELTFDVVFHLVRMSGEAGVAYSDETIYRNKKLSSEWYGIDGIMIELFPNLFCHLFYQNEEYFEGNEIMKFMC